MSTVNYNDTTPAPPTGFANIKWQSDASGNISGNIQAQQFMTLITTDYTVSAGDTFINADVGVSTITLPAAPVAWQLLTIRNGKIAPSITINGNGRNVAGAATYALYYGATATFSFNATANVWQIVANSASAWIPWTPTITASGSMTVSGVTLVNCQWQWLNPYTIDFQFAITLTLGGTASNIITIPMPVNGVSGVTSFVPCYSQSPGQGTPQDAFMTTIQVANFNIRNATNTNLALGAYTLYSNGTYRIS